ncbi:hypothetical protein Hanom_Chr15g01384911 [Helianthus anomalus]
MAPLSVFPTIIYIRRSEVFVFLFHFSHILHPPFQVYSGRFSLAFITDRHMFAPMMNRIPIFPYPNPAPDRVKFIYSYGGKILPTLPTAASSTPAVILVVSPFIITLRFTVFFLVFCSFSWLEP